MLEDMVWYVIPYTYMMLHTSEMIYTNDTNFSTLFHTPDNKSLTTSSEWDTISWDDWMTFRLSCWRRIWCGVLHPTHK
jgi:hypothetical protein